jgi:ABC-type amino acid transport substrate-binding protein
MKLSAFLACMLPITIVLAISIWYGMQQHCTIAYRNAPVLVVGTNATFPPFTFVEDNKIVGFDIDIAYEVAKILGKTIEFKDMSFDALIPELLTGSIHFAAAGFTPTPERMRQVPFSTVYLSGEPLIIVTSQHSRAFNSLHDLQGKTVIVNLGFTSDTVASAIDGITVLRLDTVGESFLALATGRGDALVTTQSVLDDYRKKNPQVIFQISPIENTNETCALAISPVYKELIAPINDALHTMMQNGSLEIIQKKWGLL